MADYGELAEEVKLQQEETAGAAGVAVSQQQSAKAFVDAVRESLRKEIGKANPELEQRGLLTGALAGGVTMESGQTEKAIRIQFGANRFCNVTFSTEDYSVDVSLEEIEGQVGLAVNDVASFSIGFEGSDALAFREIAEEAEERIAGLTPDQLAEFLIVAIVRGSIE